MTHHHAQPSDEEVLAVMITTEDDAAPEDDDGRTLVIDLDPPLEVPKAGRFEELRLHDPR